MNDADWVMKRPWTELTRMFEAWTSYRLQSDYTAHTRTLARGDDPRRGDVLMDREATQFESIP